QYRKAEENRIPQDIDYESIPNIRIEARQKLSRFRPETIAQASNIQGISPADIQVLLVYLKSLRNKNG
ncbi:MAG: tRNA uridine-5-carboxymethylaminomethyl(34) synthesis enzyme MnmG, partial [Lachnospiraceae bacterium]|nr:tRNA uridine-5-carboxymethylaminomethyl(34) synthesis enzyme MnmG [Lachnospiraceae bacterium]